MSDKNQCVYFFRHLNLSPVKIGFSSKENLMSRFEQFKKYAPFGAEIIGYIKTDNGMIFEKFLHTKYASKRLKGEWFDLTIEEVEKCIDIHSKTNNVKEEKISNKGKKKFIDKYSKYITIKDSYFSGDAFDACNIFLDEYDLNGLRINKSNLKNLFLKSDVFKKSNDKTITSTRFNKYVKWYCQKNEINLKDVKSNGARVFKFNC